MSIKLYLKINRAHEVLTNPELKEIYDIYGEEGLNQEDRNPKQRRKRVKIKETRNPNLLVGLEEAVESHSSYL